MQGNTYYVSNQGDDANCGTVVDTNFIDNEALEESETYF